MDKKPPGGTSKPGPGHGPSPSPGKGEERRFSTDSEKKKKVEFAKGVGLTKIMNPTLPKDYRSQNQVVHGLSNVNISMASSAAGITTSPNGSKYSTQNMISSTGKSIGINVNINDRSSPRTRIDNLGVQHEYPAYPTRALHEEAVFKSLNETNTVSLSLPSRPRSRSPSYQKKSSSSMDNIHAKMAEHVVENELRGIITECPIAITPIMQTSHIFIGGYNCKIKASAPQEVLEIQGTGLREICNDAGRRIFYVVKTSSTRCFEFLLLWGLFRQRFEYRVLDKNGKEALKVKGSQYIFGFISTTIITYGDGSFLAKLKQSWCDGNYRVFDEEKRIIFTIIGPVFACYAPCVFTCCDEEFEIFLSGSADEVGRIGKYWDKEDFPMNADQLGACFPTDLSVRSKAILLGACISIRYQYFVKGGNGVAFVPFYLFIVFVGVFVYFNCFSLCKIH